MIETNSENLNNPEEKSGLNTVFNDTVSGLENILRDSYYVEILKALSRGKATAELRKKIFMRAIDETWISAIEDALPSIDVVINNPRKFIEDSEIVLPISQSKSINARSIRHLAQHVDYISEIRGDEITPAKILNVFHDETMMTYENKFVNTLLDRLWTFVSRRYHLVKDNPENSKSVKLSFDNDFQHGDVKGKINFSFEIEEPEKNTEEKDYTKSGDLWKRVERIYHYVQSYMNSEFVKNMDTAFVRPPIIHTNAIMKNKNYHDCLELWSFIETYETTGYSLVVDEHIEKVDKSLIKNIYKTMAVDYVLFRNKLKSDFVPENTLDEASKLEFNPQIIEELEPDRRPEYDQHYDALENNKNKGRDLTELDHRILAAIDEALDAEAYRQRIETLRKNRPSLLRSYISKIIQGTEEFQDTYSLLKNTLLSYENMKSRISWKGEKFLLNKTEMAQLSISGKSFVLYLRLDPADPNVKKYHLKDVSKSSAYKETPFALRISSKKSLENAVELIEVLLENRAEKNPTYQIEDFGMPYETDNQLIHQGLIRTLSGYEAEEVLEKNDPIEYLDSEINVSASGTSNLKKFLRSYMSKLIQSDDMKKEFYDQIKNELLAYGLKSRISSSYEMFTLGRKKYAKILFKGKTLSVALLLNPSDYETSKFHHTDLTKSGKNTELPLLMKVRSKRALKLTLELLGDLGSKNKLLRNETIHETYVIPYETDEQLIEKGLIKVSSAYAKMNAVASYNPNYEYSFVAAMTLATEEVSKSYSLVKNAFMRGVGCRTKLGEYYEVISNGRNILAKFAVKSGILTCFVPLTPGTISPLQCPNRAFKDVPYLSDTKMAVELTTRRAAEQFIKVIVSRLFEIYNIEIDERKTPVDYEFDQKSEQQLLQEGLIVEKDIPVEEISPENVSESGNNSLETAETASEEAVAEPLTEPEAEKKSEDQPEIPEIMMPTENEETVSKEETEETVSKPESVTVSSTEGETDIETLRQLMAELRNETGPLFQTDAAETDKKTEDRSKNETEKKGLFSFFKRKGN